MTEDDFCEFLNEAIHNHIEEIEDIRDPNKIFSIRTFEDCCILTSNKGLVVKLGNSKFQVTVVKDDRYK